MKKPSHKLVKHLEGCKNSGIDYIEKGSKCLVCGVDMSEYSRLYSLWLDSKIPYDYNEDGVCAGFGCEVNLIS